MIGLRCVEVTMTMLSRFHRIPERDGQTDGQTDGQNCYINIARQCADTRYKDKFIPTTGL